MNATQLPTTIDYITDAAHLIYQHSPETSAHLMIHRASLLGQNSIALSDTQRQHVCTACGNIMVPGINSRLILDAKKMIKKNKKRAKSSETEANGPRKSITCERCQSVTNITLDSVRPARRKTSKTKKLIDNSEAKMMPVDTIKPTANSNSKKRAKNRKAGLQALLSSQSKPSKSLSLSDFMK